MLLEFSFLEALASVSYSILFPHNFGQSVATSFSGLRDDVFWDGLLNARLAQNIILFIECNYREDLEIAERPHWNIYQVSQSANSLRAES